MTEARSNQGDRVAANAPDPARSHTFTVFTPTFNRATTLHRVFESLSKQTFTDFEWLIVDDGSTDDTEMVVQAWATSATFPIRYIRAAHGGKHIAFNRGVREARGLLFLSMDSDDACVPESLERFWFHWTQIPEDNRSRYSSVTALVNDEHGALVGTEYPAPIFDSNALDLRFRYRVAGDKWGFQRTDVLRMFPFPEVKGVNYVPEILAWYPIARRFQTRFVNERLLIYFQAGTDRLSVGQVTPRDAIAMRLGQQALLDDYLDYAIRSPRDMLKAVVNYSRFGLAAGAGLRGSVSGMHTWHGRLLVALGVPVGVALHLRDRRGSGRPRSGRPS